MFKAIGVAGFGGAVGFPIWVILLGFVAVAGASVAIGYAVGHVAAGATVAAVVAS